MTLTVLVVSTAVIGISILLGISSKYVFKSLKDDNIIEEICEQVVKDKTGVEIDFTPMSKESEQPEEESSDITITNKNIFKPTSTNKSEDKK